MWNPFKKARQQAYEQAVAFYHAEYDTAKVNRVEVIDDTNGRAYANYDAYNVIVQLQDNGRTLKVFIGR